MFSAYMLGNLFGFFLVMIICDILAIIFACKVVAWPIYGIGAGLTLISLIGSARSLMVALFPEYFSIQLICYAVLLFIGAFFIVRRRRKEYREYREYVNYSTYSANGKIECPDCHNIIESRHVFCPHCNHKF